MDYKELIRVADSRVADELSVSLEQKFDALFNKYVPESGKAETVGGEILRAMARIAYRFYNDGEKVGNGHGNITCNGSDRFLTETVDGYISMHDANDSEDAYEELLIENIELVVALLKSDPSLLKKHNETDSRVVTSEDEAAEREWESEYDLEDEEETTADVS